MSRIFRCMICLMLICAFLVNISPIRTKAFSTTAVVATSVLASVLIGLGFKFAGDAVAESDFLNSFVSYFQAIGYKITDGLLDVISLGNGLYGVKSDFVQDTFDTLYAGGHLYLEPDDVIDAGTTVTINASGSWKQTVTGTSPFVYYGVLYPGTAGRYKLTTYLISAVSNKYVIKGDMYSSTGSTKYSTQLAGNPHFHYYQLSTNSDITDFATIHIPYIQADSSDVRNLIGNMNETIKSDYADLEYVAPVGSTIAVGYPNWTANSVTVPNTETGTDDVYYPIVIAPTLDDLKDVTQEDIWTGDGTITDSETGTGTGSGTVTVPDNATLKDILTGVLTLPQAIAQAVSGFFSNVVTAVQAIPAAIQAIPAAIADFFSVKGEVGNFTISLSDYFPFCIPFDIYDFLTCLNADPVAPVIEWAIFEPDGTAHPITVDLSAYDSVALLLRRLQLLLFCVGLAAKTRDLIKG